MGTSIFLPYFSIWYNKCANARLFSLKRWFMMRIYYVEDEKDLAEIIRKYLNREGYETTVFHDGESAMEKIKDPVDYGFWILC
jgi:PleD family two-component response regulator